MILTRSLLQIQRVPKVASKFCRVSALHRPLSSVAGDIKPHDHVYGDEDIEKVNEEYRGTIEIKCTAYGRGIFTLRDFVPGDFIMAGKAIDIRSEPDSHTIQTGWNSHALMNLPAIMINHSCAANVGLKLNSHGAYDFFAAEDISEGKQIFFDYETTEYKIQNFNCSCGTPECRGELKGFSGNGDVVTKQYGPNWISDYLKTEKP